jgi:hypothetical protein
MTLSDDLPVNYILTEINETKKSLTYKQVKPEEIQDFTNARKALQSYEDLAILV